MPDSPFSMNAAISPGMADAPPTPEQNAGAAWSKAADYLGTTKQRAEDADRLNKTEYTMHSDGTVEVKTDAATVKMFQDALKMQQQIQGIYEQKIKENEAQQAGMKAHPFANALAQIGASVGASSKDPLVRGLGDAAQRLNPTSAQLKQEQMGLLKGAQGAAEGQADMAMRALAMQQQGQQRQAMANERVQTNWEQLTNKATDIAKTTGAPPDKNEFYRSAMALGKPLTDVESAWKNVETVAQNKLAQEKRTEATAVDKATEIAKATAPIKIQIGEKMEDKRQENRKEMLDLRTDAQKKLIPLRWDARVKGNFQNMLNRMDAGRLKGLGELSQTDFKDLENASSMRQFVDHMYEFFGPGGKLSGYVGPWEGLMTSKMFSSLSDSDRQTAKHMFMVERKRLIDWGRAGVMGWRPSEDTIKSLGLLETLRPEALTNIYKEVHNQLDLQTRSKVRNKPFAPWDMMPEALGGAENPVYKEAAARSGEFYKNVDAIRERGMERLEGKSGDIGEGKKTGGKGRKNDDLDKALDAAGF